VLKIEQHPNDGLVVFLDSLEATEKQVQTAARRTIRKTIRWLRTAIARHVAREKKLRVGDVKTTLIEHGTEDPLKKRLYLSKRYRVISAYKVGRARQTKKGVRVRDKLFENAFLATMSKTGHTGIFRRKGKARLPIQEMYIVIAPAIERAMRDYVGDKGRDYMERTFNHELKYEMRKK